MQESPHQDSNHASACDTDTPTDLHQVQGSAGPDNSRWKKCGNHTLPGKDLRQESSCPNNNQRELTCSRSPGNRERGRGTESQDSIPTWNLCSIRNHLDHELEASSQRSNRAQIRYNFQQLTRFFPFHPRLLRHPPPLHHNPNTPWVSVISLHPRFHLSGCHHLQIHLHLIQMSRSFHQQSPLQVQHHDFLLVLVHNLQETPHFHFLPPLPRQLQSRLN